MSPSKQQAQQRSGMRLLLCLLLTREVISVPDSSVCCAMVASCPATGSWDRLDAVTIQVSVIARSTRGECVVSDVFYLYTNFQQSKLSRWR